MKLKFELLCIDLEHKVKFRKPENFVRGLSIIESLWNGNPQINEDGLFLEDTSSQIKVSIQPFDTSKMATGERFASAFLIITEGEYHNIEPFRLKIIQQISDLNFKYVKILNDEVSDAVAKKIFPLLNSIENFLRKYIVKFFLTKIGIDWWTLAVSKEIRDKSMSKKSNETVFTKPGLIVADVTLMNFDQIGKIIYSQSSIFTKIEDIIEKIKSSDDIDALKKDVLEGNYAKYFKDTFEQKDFQKKWEDLTFIRNKVAHNNYCIEQDYLNAKNLVENLMEILIDADNSIEAFSLSIADKEAVKKAIDNIVTNDEDKEIDRIEENNIEQNKENREESPTIPIDPQISTQNSIRKTNLLTENELIEKLKVTAQGKNFVGLKYFVREVLGASGYAINSSYALINLLADKGVLEIYAVENPNGQYDTTAVKIIKI